MANIRRKIGGESTGMCFFSTRSFFTAMTHFSSQFRALYTSAKVPLPLKCHMNCDSWREITNFFKFLPLEWRLPRRVHMGGQFEFIPGRVFYDFSHVEDFLNDSFKCVSNGYAAKLNDSLGHKSFAHLLPLNSLLIRLLGGFLQSCSPI